MIQMDDWRTLINKAIQNESNVIQQHKYYTEATEAAIAEAQAALETSAEVSAAMETVYGAMVAYTHQAVARMRAEDSDPGSVDHAFRTGQAYGVSCVLNHIIDQLKDPNAGSLLADLDAFSDEMHDNILIDAKKIGLTVELLDAKGDYVD